MDQYWEKIFKDMGVSDPPRELFSDLEKARGDRGMLTMKLMMIMMQIVGTCETMPAILDIVDQVTEDGFYYIVEINDPHLFYCYEDAKKEIKRRKREQSQLYNGTFKRVYNRLHIYQFGSTIAANKAKITDFNESITIRTDKILPPVSRLYLEIDLDVVVVPLKKIRKLEEDKEKLEEDKEKLEEDKEYKDEKIRDAYQCFSQNNVEVGLRILKELVGTNVAMNPLDTNPAMNPLDTNPGLDANVTVDPLDTEMVTPLDTEMVTSLDTEMVNPNEDDVSKSVHQQVAQFASKNGLNVIVNKARMTENVDILALTKYAKSRPDMSILTLNSFHQNQEEEEEEGGGVEEEEEEEGGGVEEEEEEQKKKAVGANTEHKEKLKGDAWGQTLAGAEKICGEVVHDFLRSEHKPVTIIEVYSLLIDYQSKKAEVFKVCIDFSKKVDPSKIYRGSNKLEVTDALNRVFHQLLSI